MTSISRDERDAGLRWPRPKNVKELAEWRNPREPSGLQKPDCRGPEEVVAAGRTRNKAQNRKRKTQ